MARRVLEVARHRNGVCGEPFHVVLFREDGRRMVAVRFEAVGDETGWRYCTAVFDLDDLAGGNVAFGPDGNSWRGDVYTAFVRR